VVPTALATLLGEVGIAKLRHRTDARAALLVPEEALVHRDERALRLHRVERLDAQPLCLGRRHTRVGARPRRRTAGDLGRVVVGVIRGALRQELCARREGRVLGRIALNDVRVDVVDRQRLLPVERGGKGRRECDAGRRRRAGTGGRAATRRRRRWRARPAGTPCMKRLEVSRGA
jgi:hypothetical protein